MKASKFTDAQKAFIIRQGEDGIPVAEICRKAGISQATYFNWKKKYAGLMPSEMKRLRELEEENSRLKRIVADLTLDREMLQDVIKRKLLGLIASASWSARCAMTGRYQSAGPVGFSPLIPSHFDTRLVDTIRPLFNSAFGKSARRACAMVIGACMSCCNVKVGR
tara:strand:+ start:11727 stop:12221 length:495 start_codon:yes stop_codon:yes gene_type:complete